VTEARAVAAQAAQEVIAALPAPSDLEQQQLTASVRSGVLSIVERDAAFLPDCAPAHLEWAFGAAEGDPGVDLGGVTIKGRADRIDVGPAGLVVIDYKRSTAPSRAAIAREGRLQLQLYALAASSRLGLPVAGGLYRRLDRPEDRGFLLSGVPGAFKPNDVVDEAGLQEVLDAAVDTARIAAQGIAASFIEPSADARGCAWCGASAVCGVAHA
jgi:RecB family exonuclease